MEVVIQNLTKKYGTQQSLKQVSLNFREGKFYGLIGLMVRENQP
ncbi:hypothetical protein [Bombilactobacillus apium]|nr:hypothetical protein [Bombilactobacillus apium]